MRFQALVLVALGCGTLLGGAGCTPGHGGWSMEALRQEHPEIELHRGHRLGDAAPYFVPIDGGLLLFLCHWDPEQTLAYSLPDDATEQEEGVLEAAVRAWQDAGLGLEFERVPRERALLKIAFAEGNAKRAPAGAATAAADCAVALGPGVSARAHRVPARIVRAEIRLRRSNRNVLGREVELRPEELAGTLLHEIGHALGFPTHVVDDSAVMSRSVDTVRRAGRKLLANRRFVDPTLGALYAVPSGTVVGFLPLESEQLRPLSELLERAQAQQWAGPYVRVGDRSARIWWLSEKDDAMGFRIPRSARDWSKSFELFPTAAWAREDRAVQRGKR